MNSPATRSGNYEVLGRLTIDPGSGNPANRTLAPGEVSFKVNLVSGGDGANYGLHASAGILPSGLTSLATSIESSWEINQNIAYQYDHPYASYTQALGQRLTAFDKSSGGTESQVFSYDYTRGSTNAFTSSSSNTNLQTTLTYDIGYSYVAMGEWSWSVVDLNGNPTPSGNRSELLFVDGDRTSAAGIPASGTATYDARTLLGVVTSPFTLTADFGQRTISALIDQDYRYQPDGDTMDYPLAWGIHVSGSSPFSADGLFDIPLSGTVNYTDAYPVNTSAGPPSQPVTGDMNGAFFGPHAEQVGGTFSLQGSGGATLMQDAFVGQQHH